MLFLLFVVTTAASFLVNQTDASAHMEEINSVADKTLTLLTSDLTAAIAKQDPAQQSKGFFSGMWSGMKSMISSQPGDPVQDFLQLATYYQALNYADLAVLELLRKNCTSDGLIQPKTDASLCGAYRTQLMKMIETRIGVITSRYLYSNQILNPPSGWTGHAREVLKTLESYPQGQDQLYSLENTLIKAYKDKLTGKIPDEPVPKPKASPMALLSSIPSVIYGPGQPTTVQVSMVPNPMTGVMEPTTTVDGGNPVVGGAANGMLPNSNAAVLSQGQPLSQQVINGQVIASNASPGLSIPSAAVQPMAMPVMAIPVMSASNFPCPCYGGSNIGVNNGATQGAFSMGGVGNPPVNAQVPQQQVGIPNQLPSQLDSSLRDSSSSLNPDGSSANSMLSPNGSNSAVNAEVSVPSSTYSSSSSSSTLSPKQLDRQALVDSLPTAMKSV